MRRLGIFLDASSSMSAKGSDFQPNPLLFSIHLLEAFIPDFMRRNTLGSAAVYELRDGVCSQIAPAASQMDSGATASAAAGGGGSGSGGKFSSNPNQLVGDLQSRFQAKGGAAGSGTASIVNALRIMACDLGSDSSPTLGFSGTCTSTALLITSSITLVDAGDVFAALDEVAKLGVAVDILSFSGAPHVLEVICKKTRGNLMCPVSSTSALELLLNVAHPSWAAPGGGGTGGGVAASQQNANNKSSSPINGEALVSLNAARHRHLLATALKRERVSDDEFDQHRQSMTPIALFHDTTSIPTQCPLCFAPQTFFDFPRTCPSCGLLSLSEVQWRTARAEASAAAIVVTPVVPDDGSGQRAGRTSDDNAAKSAAATGANSKLQCCGGVCSKKGRVVFAGAANEDQQLQRVGGTNTDDDVDGTSFLNVSLKFALRCSSCNSPFCKDCAMLFSESVRICPSCGVMLE